MRRTITFAVLTLSLLSSRALPQQAPTTSSIEGVVVRADTGEPIANAQVTLTNAPGAGGPGGVIGGVLGGVVGGAGTLTATATAGFSTAAPGTAVQLAPIVGNTVEQQLVQAGQRPGQIPPVTTGADGKFVFKDLNAGGYRVVATATGFVRQEYGQRALNGQGRPLFLTAGQPIKDAAIRLTPTGTISGRVYDENGQPATGAPVQVVRAFYNAQGKTYSSAGTAAVDDRGDYRVYGITPGRYYLLAGTPPGPAGLRGIGAGSARFSMVYYPNAADIDQASPVEVKAGGETSFDLRLTRQTQTFRVRGRVVDPTGAAIPQNTNVMLGYRTFTGGGGTFSSGRSFDPATSTFDLQGVAPGDYTVQIQLPVQNVAPLPNGPIDPAQLAARQAEQAMRPGAAVPIHVTNADIDGLVLTLSTGVTTTGRLVVEGQPISVVPNLDRLRLNFSSPFLLPSLSPPTALPFAPDGTFQVVGLREGEYRVQLGVPNFYVKTLKYGGEDILGKPFKFSGSGSGTFEVILKAGAATSTGTVTDAKSQPVPGVQVVFVPAQRNRFDLFRPGITDQNGKFTIANLPPGEYKVFSWEAADNNAFFDPDFLKQYEQQGKAVTIAESSNPSVEVRLIPAP